MLILCILQNSHPFLELVYTKLSTRDRTLITALVNSTLPSFELVVVEAIFSQDEEVVFFVSLAVLALHVPVVLASHLVLVFLLPTSK